MRITHSILTLLFLCSFSLSYSQNCYDADSVTIQRLYDGLGVSYTGAVVDWPGVVSYSIHPNSSTEVGITAIDLSNSGLTGVLRDSIFENDQLLILNSLNLSNNAIQGLNGPLRYSTGAPFPSLSELNVDSNAFVPYTNFFFDLMLNLNSLNEVSATKSLAANTLSVHAYTFNYNNILRTLSIGNNGFTDTLHIDTFINHFFDLANFAVHDNSLEAVVTNNTTPLETFDVSDNELLHLHDLANLINKSPNLREVQATLARTNAFEDTFKFDIPTVHTNLLSLNLSENKLVGTIPLDILEKFSSIQDLNLSFNFLSGPLPLPATQQTGGLFPGAYYYEGLGQLKYLSLNDNSFSGPLRLDWLMGQQFTLYQANSGQQMPLEELYCQYNNFEQVLPASSDPFASIILTTSWANRFTLLEKVFVAGNQLDFLELYRIQSFFRMQQVASNYYPQAATGPNAFDYVDQQDLGLAGVRRRNAGDSITLFAGHGLEELIDGGASTKFLANRYYWERIDTTQIVGGTSIAPVFQYIGEFYQNGTAIIYNPTIIDGLSGSDPTYKMGIYGSAGNGHRIRVGPLDSTNHAEWLYRAEISNPDFPLTTIFSKAKKIEVGPCYDLSGNPITCQQMILRFDPAALAGLSQFQQDSVKQALQDELGSKPIESCLCGDLELWSVSDTAVAMLEKFGSGTEKAATTTSTKPELLSADPNYSLLAAGTTTIPLSTPPPSGTGNNSAKTLVAIIDAGLDYGYTSLHAHVSEGLPVDTSCIDDAMWGYNFLTQDNDASDDHGHGTQVAGIVAGLSKNNLLPDDAASDIGILPLKYTNNEGKGSLFHAACALRYAAKFEKRLPTGDIAKVRVINASWGFKGDKAKFLEDALLYVDDACDILVVASAGNEGISNSSSAASRHWPSNSISDPADTIDTDNVLAVAAINTHTSENLASYSNYSFTTVDIAAQGTDSTCRAGSVTGFEPVQGTSFATAQVSRAAALLFDKYPDASYFAIKSALIKGVDKFQSADSLKLRSGGRLNYQKADSILNAMTNRTICADYFPYISVDKIEDLAQGIRLFPNPTHHNLNVEWDSELSNETMNITVFNAQGQVLYQRQLDASSQQCNIPTHDFPAGMYFIRLEINQQPFSKKFMKI